MGEPDFGTGIGINLGASKLLTHQRPVHLNTYHVCVCESSSYTRFIQKHAVYNLYINVINVIYNINQYYTILINISILYVCYIYIYIWYQFIQTYHFDPRSRSEPSCRPRPGIRRREVSVFRPRILEYTGDTLWKTIGKP